MVRQRLAMSLMALACAGVARADTLIGYFPGAGAGDHFGDSVRDAGDINRDGYADVIVGAADYTGPAITVKVFSGKDRSVVRQWSGDKGFGWSVAGAGDVDDDGWDDVIIGGDGAAHVYSGRTGAALFTFIDFWADFGFAVDGAGDVNHDGHADLLVAAPWAFDKRGYVRLYSGNNGVLLREWDGTSEDEYFGFSVSGNTDFDLDGTPDVLIGAPLQGEGIARVYSGQTGNLIGLAAGPHDGSEFGYSVSGGPDVNGDGYPDFVAGAPTANTNGSSSGMAKVISGKTFALLFSLSGESAGDMFGWSVSNCGDVNGDGRSDVVIGSPYERGSPIYYAGAVRVFSGLNASKLFTLYGHNTDNDLFGHTVSGAGDVNGDGHADILIGDPGFTSLGTSTGAAWLHSGQDYDADWTTYGTGWPGSFGVPEIALDHGPVLCDDLTLFLGNSRLVPTVGTVFVGLSSTTLPTAFGGTMLVAPPWLLASLAIPGNGLAVSLPAGCDTSLLGLHLFLQVIELDPGASHGVSFTRGLELTYGL